MASRYEHPARKVISVIAAACFALYGAEILINDARLNAGGKTVRAEEVARWPRQKGSGWVCKYAFQAGNERRTTEESCGGTDPQIDYLPSQPSLTRMHGSREAVVGWIPLTMGTVCLTAFGVDAWVERRKVA